MEDDQERSLIEIKALLHKLNTRGTSNHKDRVRALKRFRNFASASNSTSTSSKKSTPDFYDDDLPLFFLGSESPPALYDQSEYWELSAYTGLLQACAMPSSGNGNGYALKRSARNAMHLLKYLCCDHVDLIDGEPAPLGVDGMTGLIELNPFAHVLCSLKPEQLRLANFDAHLQFHSGAGGGDASERNGARIEACHVLVLLFTRHFDPNADFTNANANANANVNHPTLLMEDLLTTQTARQSFDNWMVQNVSKDVQNTIKARTAKISSPAKLTPAKASMGMENGNGRGNGLDALDLEEDVEVDIVDAFKKKAAHDEHIKNAMAEAGEYSGV